MTQTSEMFGTGEPLLQVILNQIHSGMLQLPDFQRGWVWDDQHIKDLISSVSLAYPIGSTMFLRCGGDTIRLKPRLVEGVELSDQPIPKLLILDGQQRLTSLYQVLKANKPAATTNEKKQKIERWYYFDMEKCVDSFSDRVEAVIGIPANRVITRDFGREVVLDIDRQEKEFEKRMFPLSLIYDTPGLMLWENGFQKHHNFDPAATSFLAGFKERVLLPFQQYKIPTIELFETTPKIAVCQVFERVNTGGVNLTVFELLTATFAADEFNLREDWDARRDRLHTDALLRNVDSDAFLTSITLLASYRRSLEKGSSVSCKRNDVLELSLDDYKACADEIEKGLKAAARLLIREKIFDARELPYGTQYIPLSAICATLGSRFEQDQVKKKLAQWYWCGVLGELYGGANETRYAFDLPEVVDWVDGGSEPRTIRDAAFSPIRLASLQTRGSAAYKGIMALLLQAGSSDFLSGDTIEVTKYVDLNIDIHHIFPSAYCQKVGLPRELWNSVVNKAPISAQTNRMIGGRAPSLYLKSLENKQITGARLNEMLETHLIDPTLLKADNFNGFIINRAGRILDLIENAMGKPVQGRDADDVINTFGAPVIGA